MSVVGRLSILGAFIAGSVMAQPTSPFVTILDVVSGLNDVVGMAHPGGDDERLFIVEQSGRIRILQNGAVLSPPFIDLGQNGLDLSTFCNTGGCGERGLLGLAFHPNYPVDPFFYVYYTRQTDGDIVIARYTVSADPNLANTGSGSTVLVIEHSSQGNHNGGGIAFGPDGNLYLSVGDGGSGGDPPENAQNLNVLLGKVLRLDIDGDDFPGDANLNYAVPLDNPFVDAPGADEIWTVGLRNPFRIGFDREGGRLFIGDVGQGSWEEVDLQQPLAGGVNFGWDCREGAHPADPPPPGGDEENCDELASMVDPILEYANPTGPPDGPAAVTGGYVYRGGTSAGIYGDYIFADFYSGLISRGVQNGLSWTREDLIDTDYLISTFGEDKDGKLYFANYSGSIHRIAPYSFSDVKPGDIGWAVIEALYLAGVAQGCAGGRYCPDGGIQRQQAAALLIRARDIGSGPPPNCASDPFTDVPAASQYCPWIAELIEPAQPISMGCNAPDTTTLGTRFCPTSPLTRAALARFLLRTLDSPAATTLSSCAGSPPFTDVPATHPLCDWIKTAEARGVLDTCVSNTHFCPDDPVRRDQLAAILVKAVTIDPQTP